VKRPANLRVAQLADAAELALLCGELGYPSSINDIETRLPALLSSADHLVLVAADANDRAVAWLHASARRQLESEAFVQIAGLVVAEPHRNKGLGSRLLAHAEAWAHKNGVPLVRVRSNVIRTRAHSFYIRAGYSLVKTSHLFVKAVHQSASAKRQKDPAI
jgi:GNAT superfamily N-acetyltransferase